MSAICLRCSTSDESVEFASVRELAEHEKGGHLSRPVKQLPPSVDRGLSATELAAAKKEVEEKVKTVPGGQVIEYEGAPPIIVKPLELKYKWMGIHPPCNTEVKTIEVDLGARAMIIAYCINCDQKLQQLEVIPIKQQGLDQAVNDDFERNVKPKKDKS